MAYTPNEFQYSLIAFDAKDLSSETADIFSMRDNQIQDYLRTETSEIKAETDSLGTSITSLTTSLSQKLDTSRFRFGSAVITLPNVNNSEFISFSSSYPSGTANITVVLVNGHFSANRAILAPDPATRFGFDVYHVSNGTAGNACRVNYIAFTL